MRPFVLAGVVATLLAPGAPVDHQNAFLVKPYLQLGNRPGLSNREGMTVVWHATGTPASWKASVKTAADKKERNARVQCRNVTVRTAIPQQVCRAELSNLIPGETFQYAVTREGARVFESSGRARHSAAQPYRFAVFGDCGANTAGQRAIAWQVWQAKPDFVMHPGDIVYSRGRISEYAVNYFPFYNADAPSPEAGVPLMRSTLFIGAPGNHDIAVTDVTAFPDGLAYFYFWANPLNGPLVTAGAANTPILQGLENDQKAFLAAAADQYPRMANYSFDYGNAHWTILDSNANVDWRDPFLRDWLEKDLKSARGALWRFVVFHHPGFNSSKSHFTNQWMRGIAPLLEAGAVDVVFNGHVHNYQRTFPMKFVPSAQGLSAGGLWDGQWTLDKKFVNGATKPGGVIYLITGAGGARLYNPEQEHAPESWQAFTQVFRSNVHSYSLVEMKDRTFTLRQIGQNGEEIDRFVINK